MALVLVTLIATPLARGQSTGSAAGDSAGAARLGGEDGITGTVDGTVYTYTRRTSPVGPSAIVVQGDAEVRAGDGQRWSLRFPNRVGTYECGPTLAVGSAHVRLRRESPAGVTTGRGSCVIHVTSVGDVYEGSFSGMIDTDLGLLRLTAGAFRVHSRRGAAAATTAWR